MPGRDGTGPLGNGPFTGRGLGFCTGAGAALGGVCLGAAACRRLGLGRGRGRGFGRYFSADYASPEAQKDILMREKEYLQDRLSSVEKSIESL